MAQRFDRAPAERPDPTHFLKKREGSPGGLKAEKHAASAGSPQRSAGSGSAGGCIPAHHGAPGAAPGSPRGASPGTSKGRSAVFAKMYDRGDLPCAVDQGRRAGAPSLRWKADLATIDLHFYLPVFVDGLLETQEPYRMLARRGVEELVLGCGGDRVLPVIPQLIMGLRAALASPTAEVVRAGLHAVALLLRCSESAGPALVPYYRQLLPPLSRHIDDALGDAVLDTLYMLERAGGPEAFLHIKYYVPTYESCLHPSRLTRKP